MSPTPSKSTVRKVLLLSQVLTFSVLLGRAYQLLVWEGPFRYFIYDSSKSKWLAWLRGMSWEEHLASPTTEQLISNIQHGFGWVFLSGAVMVLFARQLRNWIRPFMVLETIGLVILAYLYFYNKQGQVHQLVEYGIQAFMPVAIVLLINPRPNYKRILKLSKIAVAATFAGHAVYALGIFGQPGNFIDMTISILHCDQRFAQQFLHVAGALDLMVVVGIFMPAFQRIALWYAVFWGTTTAVARAYAVINPDLFLYTLEQVWQDTAYRLPHGGLPLLMIWLTNQVESHQTPTNSTA